MSAGQVVANAIDPLTGERAEVPSSATAWWSSPVAARLARDDNLVVLAQPELGIARGPRAAAPPPFRPPIWSAIVDPPSAEVSIR